MHIPVLADAILEWLRVREDGVYVDCTVGMGGHSAMIAERLGAHGRLIALDRDASALATAQERLSAFPIVQCHKSNYADLAEVAEQLNIDAVDGILIDAGVSSVQLDSADRGFSFQTKGPLDMRMDASSEPSAREYLATVSEAELSRVLKEYGDLRHSKKIARAICARRDEAPLTTTEDLLDVVSQCYDFVQGIPDEVRTVFQAIRIAVNDELVSLERGIRAAVDLLAPQGRLLVISFHSGEDRVVKNVFRDLGRRKIVRHLDGRTKESIEPILRILTRKPILPSDEEMSANSRSRSAKLRVAERVAS